MNTKTITIYRNDIYFDVDAVTHALALASASSDVKHADALESDTGDSSNASLISRFADTRVAELKRRLGRFLDDGSTASASSSISSGDYSFSLSVESGFISSLLAPLAHEIESYIANGVIADWYNATGSPQAAAYAAKLEPTYVRIVESIVKRKFPSRS